MEVSKVSTAVSHVVLGGEEAIQMGITESSEFYQMLSSALYRNPKLAMIRETICNCWDAHKMALPDGSFATRPVEITIDQERIVFRDFGPGIPKDKIGPIYGVYGNSTKRDDKNATGGFGLGCKSPFAYQEHFQVISHNAGEKTIYRMAKSSGKIKGKPSITPIVTVPTTESGLEVTIDIKNTNDYGVFLAYINQVVINAGVPTIVNGNLITGVDYAAAKKGYLISSDVNGYGIGENILLKLGDVVYPISEEPEYTTVMRDLRRFLSCTINDSKYRLVLIAEPGSISITPSRESLTSDTNEVVRDLMQNVLDDLRHGVDTHYPTLIRKLNDYGIDLAQYNSSIRRQMMTTVYGYAMGSLHTAFRSLGVETKNLMDKRAIAAHTLIQMYPSKMIKSDFKYRFGKCAKFVHDEFRHLVPKVLKNLQGSSGDFTERTDTIQRVLATYFMKLHPKINPKLIHVMNERRIVHEYYESKYILKSLNKLGIQDVDSVVNMMNPVIVLYRAERNLVDRVNTCIRKSKSQAALQECHEDPILKIHSGSFWAIKAPSTAKGLEEIREILKDSPWIVIDAVGKFEWEKSEKEKSASNRPKGTIARRKHNAFYSAFSIMNTSRQIINHHYVKQEGKLIEFEGNAPEFYISIQTRGNSGQTNVGTMNGNDAVVFLNEYGHRGIVVSTAAQTKKAIEAGAIDVEQFLKKIVADSWQDWKIRRAMTYNTRDHLNRMDYEHQKYSNFSEVHSLPRVRKMFNIRDDLTPIQRMLLPRLVEAARYPEWSGIPGKAARLVRRLAKTSSKSLVRLENVCKTSDLLGVVKIKELVTLANSGNQKAQDLLTIAMKG